MLYLPISGGIQIDWRQRDRWPFLQHRSPWDLRELPLIGVQYGDRTLAVIIPWPHYASLVLKNRIGIRFSYPEGRNNVDPAQLVVEWVDNDPLAIARAFRAWRVESEVLGAIPPIRSLRDKAKALPHVSQLLGAPHIYLWGPSIFSRHDVPRRQWIPFAKALKAAQPGSAGARMRDGFRMEEQSALDQLIQADWPMAYLTTSIAGAINRALLAPKEPDHSAVMRREQVAEARRAFEAGFGAFLRPAETWGDGLSTSLLDQLDQAGIDQAVLVMSDLYSQTIRPDVVGHARELGYVIGPYDSYHSVHSPDTAPDETWETAQFDRLAFETGRIVKAKGRPQGGFKGRGYHFSPEAAWPYFRERIQRVRDHNGYDAWFVDCDATGECFDDYHPLHPASRSDDTGHRRHRLRWIEEDQGMLVGSEGGSILFADVIHFGHGVHTPYIGHLDPRFRDHNSEYFLGRHWPPDSPEQRFKPIPIPTHLRSPYFDPTIRIPLYQAVLGDELVTTHHWSFDSLKFDDLTKTRSLFEVLYAVPPMYHLSREMWPRRKERIRHHLAFWAPLHRLVGWLPLTCFERLDSSGLLQRTRYGTGPEQVAVTVNFGDTSIEGLPGRSARVEGVPALGGVIYQPK